MNSLDEASALRLDRLLHPGEWQCEACAAWTPVRRKTCRKCTAYRVDNVDPDPEPCLGCGDTCCSQLQFIYGNKAKPWPYCSGCDPGMCEGAPDCRCVDCRKLPEAS